MRVLLLIAMLAAQPADGTVRVTVTDPSGAVIIGATATLTGERAIVLASNDRGEAVFELLPPGRYTLTVQSPGFEDYAAELRVRAGQQRGTVRLSLARISQSITVDRDPGERATDPRGNAFTTILRPDQIDQLPDDPDEMARVLLEMAGPGAALRVNGFRSNRLPPKDQIQQVRFRRNAFSADNHEAGAIFVDVLTRPGGEAWRGTAGAGVRASSLNARNALAVRKEDEDLQRYSLQLNGPLWKQHTSASLSFDATAADETRTILAVMPSMTVADVITRPMRVQNATGRIEHALSPSHVMRLEFDRASGRTDRAGVGDFNLPERGYRQTNDGHGARASAVGPIGRSLFNELRLQHRADRTSFTPQSIAPAVMVLNAFNGGGAQIAGTRHARHIEIADDVDVAKANHAIRVGFQFEHLRVASDVARNQTGTFTFASLDAFRASQPTTYSRNIGQPRIELASTEFGAYVQDDVRVRKNLTVSGGLRYEHQSIVGGWNAGPRAAFVWAPFASGNTTVRAGAGIFFDWFDAQSYEYAVQLDGTHQQIATLIAPPFPLLDPAPAVALPPGRVRLSASLEQPRINQASLAIEHAMPRDIRLSAVWTHRRSANALRGLDVNAPVGGIRPDATAGQVIEIGSIARARGNTASLQFTHSPQRPLFLTATYTWSRAMNESDGPTSLPADSRRLMDEWGPAADDVRHRVTAMFSTKVIGRMRFGSSARWQSGSPFNVTTGHDDNGDAASNDRPAGVTRNSHRGRSQADVSARLSWTIGLVSKPSTGGGTGALARSKGDGDALAAFSSAVDITKRYNIELYAQAYNLLNRANVTAYSGVLTSPLFGQPIAVAPARRLELGTRLRF